MRGLLCIAVLAALLAGCDPVETELTINADGSGRMTQKVKLSPSACALLATGLGGQTADWQPILTKEGVDQWNAENTDSGIQVESFSAAEGADGSTTIQYTVTFRNVEDFAFSVWGRPLQLSITRSADSSILRFEDPLRFVVFSGTRAGSEAFAYNIESDAPGYLEQQTALQALDNAKGFASKAILHLPSRILSCEGARVDEAGTSATLEFAGGRNRDELMKWLSADTPKAVTESLAVAEFDAASVFGDSGKSKIVERILIPDGKEWRLEPAEIRHERVQERRFLAGADNDRASITMYYKLYGPTDAVLVAPYRLIPDDNSRSGLLTSVRDDKGKLLKAQLHGMSPNGFSFVPHPREGRMPTALLQIDIDDPPEDIKSLSIEGYAILYRAQIGNITLRPLKEYVGRSFDMALVTIVFTEINDNSIILKTAWKGGDTGDFKEAFTFYDSNGRVLKSTGYSGKQDTGDPFIWLIRFDFAEVPPDVYVGISCPRRIEALKVPLSFKDIAMPQ